MAAKTAKQIVRTGEYHTWKGITVEAVRIGVLDGSLTTFVQKQATAFFAEIVRPNEGGGHDVAWSCKHGHPNRRTANECADAQVAALKATA
jgi:hypothetical protein